MSDYVGAPQVALRPDDRAYVGSQSPGIFEREFPGATLSGAHVGAATLAGTWDHTGDQSQVVHDFVGLSAPGPGQFWFERIWYVPSLIELGNLLTTVTETIEIYNSHRTTPQTLDVADNNAGTGVTFEDLPTLPAEMAPQSGLLITLRISAEGQPIIDGTLDFETSLGDFSIPITGSRVVMFPYEPEVPIRELLEFKTDVLRAANGTEQRINVRKCPRQLIELDLRVPDGASARRLLSLLRGWHERVFGVPIWWESRPLDASVSAGATTITVDTRYGDFRVGSLAILWQDEDTYDALEIESKTDSSITFTSALTQNFSSVSTLVMPLRVAHLMQDQLNRSLHAVNLQEYRLQFRVIDNDVDLASTAAFGTANSKVLLDEPNLMISDTTPADLTRVIDHLDNEIGVPQQSSQWAVSHSLRQKGFLGDSLQRIWEVRQLLHALRGAQTSFYLPTHTPDVVVVNTLASGSFLMDIEHQGYTKYVKAQEPYKSLWIELTNGTVLTRQVTAYEELDADTERLTVDVSWPSTITVAEISRVCFLELTRVADDRALFVHTQPGQARILLNVKGTTT